MHLEGVILLVVPDPEDKFDLAETLRNEKDEKVSIGWELIFAVEGNFLIFVREDMCSLVINLGRLAEVSRQRTSRRHD